MATKRQVPAHIKPKQFLHPQPTIRLIQVLDRIPDPRKPSCNFQYSLKSIVFIVIVASLCGADDWAVIETLAITMKDWIAREKGADYFLPVKGNHKGLQEDIELLFKEAEESGFKGVDADQYETLEKSRGRVEKRLYYSMDADELPDKKEWVGVKSIGKVVRERSTEKKTGQEIVYYTSSCEVGAKLLGESVRDHWEVENGLHWSLDVIFREDKLRYRHEIGARNLAVIRKITLGALSKNKTYKCGRSGKRIVAASDLLFREEVLKNLF